ncbi:D-galactarate dehydratase [Candidimonas nitroreducens]|uniref:D-galactarate dehydratase n=2 Tax=Candidimonas nitroreducens TaxID=683354 RepID=A0A225MXM8_9BURK|nr:D-galactarate dehydratase [Candidimonas nitroreducens]
MTRQFLILDKTDNVGVALADLPAGSILSGSGLAESVRLKQDIPAGHKFALSAIGPAQPIRKYGVCIGLSTEAIEAGRHVHVQNIESMRGRGDRS